MCEKIEITTFQKIKQSKTTTKIISIWNGIKTSLDKRIKAKC